MDNNNQQQTTGSPRKRLKPGERRMQILQTLALTLEKTNEKITTALLAEKLDISEAALYRQFASKAQMFEALIEYIETSVFTLINQINEKHSSGILQAADIMRMLLCFAEKNPGISKVMSGEALLHEDPRLKARMAKFFDRIESSLKQSIRLVNTEPNTPYEDPALCASVLLCFFLGRLYCFTRSNFQRRPTEKMESALAYLLKQHFPAGMN